MDTLQSDYQKALQCFFLTKYSVAMTKCVKTLSRLPPLGVQFEFEPLRHDLWTLLLNIVAASPTVRCSPSQAAIFLSLPTNVTVKNDTFCSAVWTSLANGYNGAGNVNPRLVSSYLVMALKLDFPAAGRDAVEQWYAGLPDTSLDHLSNGQHQPDPYFSAYQETVELYVTRILPAMQDFESAKSFVEYNPFISNDKKHALQTSIQERQETIHRENQLSIQKEKQAKLEQQKKAQAAKLAAERAQEQKLEEEKAAASCKVDTKRDEYTPPPSTTSSSVSPTTPSGPSASSTSEKQYKQIRQHTTAARSLVFVKTWLRHLRTTGSSASFVVILGFFALLTLLQRSRTSHIAKLLLLRLWQTVQMGTKLTYM